CPRRGGGGGVWGGAQTGRPALPGAGAPTPPPRRPPPPAPTPVRPLVGTVLRPDRLPLTARARTA
ncbi:hypothetical protein ACFXPZ_36320, partial [Streptomyces sp. NPDC059101]